MTLRAQPLHFVAGRFACGIAGQPLLARLQEVLRPAIIQILVDALLTLLRTDGIDVLGEYSVGRRPLIYDPIYGKKNSTASATLLHEEVHQSLTINTTFGSFYQTLTVLASHRQHVEEWQACWLEQWGPQEAAATYIELCTVAADYPDEFENAVRRLPSSSLDQPPYREVFDILNQALPIDVGSPRDLLMAQMGIMYVMAHCAFNSCCLSTFATPDRLNPESLKGYLREQSPDARLGYILSKFVAHSSRPAILDRARFEIEHQRDPEAWLMQAISEIVPQVCVVSPARFKTESRTFEEAWSRYVREFAPNFHFRPSTKRNPLPEIVIDPEVHAKIMAQDSKTVPLNGSILREKLQRARLEGTGVFFSLAMRKLEEVRISLLLFHLSRDVIYDPRYVVRDNGGFLVFMLPIEDLFSILKEFPEFPHAATFMKFTWSHVAGDRQFLKNSIVTAQTTLRAAK